MAYTVRQFINLSYRLINPSFPNQQVVEDDQPLMLDTLNRLISYYASDGQMLTIATTASCSLSIGQEFVNVGPPSYVPTPDIPIGRLANIDSAWLLLTGVTYPLIYEPRGEFFAAWKYDPLQGLPRFIIALPQTEIVQLRLYPAPSQFFELFIRAKFQLPQYSINDTLINLPDYYIRFLMFALARDTALFKGRADAWTDKLELAYQESYDKIVAASEIDLGIIGDRQSLLNGAWRVRAGI